jgi:hypothetical protein
MIGSMRNVATQTPNLFSPTDSLLSEPLPASEADERPGPQPQKIARDFVAWCCSVGTNFRNSPDAGNFRFWLQRIKLQASDLDESEVLLEARRLFLKKIEQSLRGGGPSDAPTLLKSEEHRVGD